MLRLAHAAIALAFFCAGCGEPPLEPRDPTPGVPHFKIATYNILDKASSDPETVAVVGSTGAEIVALQEVTPEWETLLRSAYAERYPYMLFRPSGAAGLGFLSVYPLVDQKFLPAPNGWHPAWWVDVETPAGRLALLNVHLHSPEVDGLKTVSNLTSLPGQHTDEMEIFSKESFGVIPMVVLGDFNEGVDGAAIQYLEDRGFRNALPLFRPGQFTWKHRSVGGQFNQTLDHILFDGALQPLNAYVLNRGNSDHLPVVAFFEASYTWPQR